MKKIFLIPFATLIIIFAGCSIRNQSSSSSNSVESEVSINSGMVSLEATESSQEQDIDKAENSIVNNNYENIQGKVISTGDNWLSSPDSSTVTLPSIGNNEELNLWYEIIEKASDETISYLLVNDLNQAEQDLSADNIAAILRILKNSKLDIFAELGNPPTGGSYHIIALDSEKNLLWSVSFNGSWFEVTQNEKSYIFNGENSGLDEIRDYIPQDTP